MSFVDSYDQSHLFDSTLQGYSTKSSSTLCTHATVYEPVLTGMTIAVPVDRPQVKEGYGYTNTKP